MSALTSRQQAYLQAMGVTLWQAQSAPTATAEGAVANTPGMPQQVQPGDAPSDDWQTLAATVSRCELCDLHKTRTQTVFGVGDRRAALLIIGEAPGADEDRQGEPFVGRAGQLLNAMLMAIGFERSQVFIANILKCRPPNNRDPRPEEAAACSHYLLRQIALVQPKLILVVGRIAAQRLLKTDTSLARLRGRVHQHTDSGVPLVVTYHPAYLLRTPSDKRKAWEDLLFLRKTIQSL